MLFLAYRLKYIVELSILRPMKGLVLYRRRFIFVPTISGVLLFLAILCLLLYLAFNNVANFLAINEPVGSKYLVVEGWLGKGELQQAFNIFETHNYQNIIVTGGPVTNGFNEHYLTYAERASKYLLSIGFPEENIITIPSPYSAQNRTFLSAVFVRDWFSETNIVVHSLDIFSGDVHSRRTRDLYRLAFSHEVDIGILASTPDKYELKQWWLSSDATASIAKELTGLIAIACCFKRVKKGSHYEKWGIEK